MLLLEKIKKGILLLPEKEIKYANKYLNKRDFQSLYEIVDSSINKIYNSVNEDNIPTGEYEGIQLDKLIELRADIWDYKTPLDAEEFDTYDDLYDI